MENAFPLNKEPHHVRFSKRGVFLLSEDRLRQLGDRFSAAIRNERNCDVAFGGTILDAKGIEYSTNDIDRLMNSSEELAEPQKILARWSCFDINENGERFSCSIEFTATCKEFDGRGFLRKNNLLSFHSACNIENSITKMGDEFRAIASSLFTPGFQQLYEILDFIRRHLMFISLTISLFILSAIYISDPSLRELFFNNEKEEHLDSIKTAAGLSEKIDQVGTSLIYPPNGFFDFLLIFISSFVFPISILTAFLMFVYAKLFILLAPRSIISIGAKGRKLEEDVRGRQKFFVTFIVPIIITVVGGTVFLILGKVI